MKRCLVENYKLYFTKEFNNRIQKYPSLKKQIANKVRHLLKDPYRAVKSEQLVRNLKGLRSARATHSIRIIFAICEECRKNNNQELVDCNSELCERMDGDVIIFFDF
jgi:mRNA-degrading endonuclease YafQ of YafQ-DinJ toxin-antitoxin module